MRCFLSLTFGTSYNLCFAMSYKHLGLFKDYWRFTAEENAYRIFQCTIALAKLGRPLKTSLLRPQHEWMPCASFALTRLLYDSWSDSGVNRSSHDSVEAHFNSTARRCSNAVGVQVTNNHAIAYCNALPYEHLRLGCFRRLVTSGSTFLHRMLEYLAATPNSFV